VPEGPDAGGCGPSGCSCLRNEVGGIQGTDEVTRGLPVAPTQFVVLGRIPKPEQHARAVYRAIDLRIPTRRDDLHRRCRARRPIVRRPRRWGCRDRRIRRTLGLALLLDDTADMCGLIRPCSVPRMTTLFPIHGQGSYPSAWLVARPGWADTVKSRPGRSGGCIQSSPDSGVDFGGEFLASAGIR